MPRRDIDILTEDEKSAIAQQETRSFGRECSNCGEDIQGDQLICPLCDQPYCEACEEKGECPHCGKTL
jgi:hypothetical protein